MRETIHLVVCDSCKNAVKLSLWKSNSPLIFLIELLQDRGLELLQDRGWMISHVDLCPRCNTLRKRKLKKTQTNDNHLPGPPPWGLGQDRGIEGMEPNTKYLEDKVRALKLVIFNLTLSRRYQYHAGDCEIIQTDENGVATFCQCGLIQDKAAINAVMGWDKTK